MDEGKLDPTRTIDELTLRASGLARLRVGQRGIRILAGTSLTSAVRLHVASASGAAATIVEAAGGSLKIVERSFDLSALARILGSGKPGPRVAALRWIEAVNPEVFDPASSRQIAMSLSGLWLDGGIGDRARRAYAPDVYWINDPQRSPAA